MASDAGSVVPEGAEEQFDYSLDGTSQAVEPYAPDGEKAAAVIDTAKNVLDVVGPAKDDLSEFANTMAEVGDQAANQADALMNQAMQPPTIVPIPTATPPFKSPSGGGGGAACGGRGGGNLGPIN